MSLPSSLRSTSPSFTPARSAGEPAVTPATFTPGPGNAKSGRVPKLTRRPWPPCVAVPPGLDGVPFSRLGAAAGVRA